MALLDLNKKGISSSMFQKQTVEVKIELRWEGNFDPDVSAFALKNGRLAGGEDVLFYNTPGKRLFNGGLVHCGDARNGDAKPVGEADETIKIRLAEIPAEYDEIRLFLSMYGSPENNQKFGHMSTFNALILEDGKPTININLADNYGTANSLVVAKVIKDPSTGLWGITALQEAGELDLNTYAESLL